MTKGAWHRTDLVYLDFPPVALRPDVACRPHHTPVFFPEGRLSNDKLRTAQRICNRCPVRQECAEWAVRTRQPDGVWGGLGPDERQAEIKKITTPKRPRKVER